ncbi:MAG: CehA/McbA family metallohydrolase [Dehalococcoidia bacterium]
MLIDIHAHTMVGGSDSSISPEDLVQEAKRQGLDGICFTEHGGGWDWKRFQDFAARQDILVIHGLEVATELGHIGTFGLHTYVSGIHKAERLREVIDSVGGYMIAVHPFRLFYSTRGSLLWSDGDKPATLEDASRHPMFELTDAVEVLNGANNDGENAAAFKVARLLERPCTAGSDAHSYHGVGCHVTIFERDVGSEEEFLEELKAGRFRPATGLRAGKLVPYEPSV